MAEKIRASLAEAYQLKYPLQGNKERVIQHKCTSSIGVALFMNQDANQEDIIKYADLAMYQAKQAGRNSIRFYDDDSKV